MKPFEWYRKTQDVEREYYDIVAILYDGTRETVDTGYITRHAAQAQIVAFKLDDARFPNDPYICKDYEIVARTETVEEDVYDLPPSDYD